MAARFTTLTCGAILALALTSTTQAGDRAHDNGFFLRLSGGIGGSSTKIEDSGSELKMEGGTGDINIAVGGVVARNFALHGTVWGWITSDPEVTYDSSGTSVSGTLNGDLDFSAFGVGATYYFMPANMYLTGSVGVGVLSVDANVAGFSLSGESDLGPAIEIALGKEWWVGTSWGLGVALAAGVHSVPNGGAIDESWQGGNVALRFTATMN